MKLNDYITRHYGGNQSQFAACQGVKPQQITQWINKGFVVVDGVLCSPRRVLNPPANVGSEKNDEQRCFKS